MSSHRACDELASVQVVDEEDDDRWVTEQIKKGARSMPSTSAIDGVNLNGRYC